MECSDCFIHIEFNVQLYTCINKYIRIVYIVKVVASFQGARCVKNACIWIFSGPLCSLIKKDTDFIWTSQCQDTFEELKRLLISAPMLAFPDFSRSFLLETDASGSGLGAVFAQGQEDGSIRPIAFASRSLQEHEKKYRSPRSKFLEWCGL